MIDTYSIDVIINAGTAGGMNPELEIFDSVISTEAAYHDVAPDILTEFHPWLESVYLRQLTGLTRKAKFIGDEW